MLLLCILDGWGINKQQGYNAIAAARTPFYDSLLSNYPNCELEASESFVGLPEKQFGNSEVGHMCIGAGRVIESDIVRINNALKQEDMLMKISSKLYTEGTLHIIGLLSDGGVHSHIDQLLSISAKMQSIGVKIKLHIITDGRDTSSKSAKLYIKQIEGLDVGTIGGRYYAMDRDNNLDRTTAAFQAIANARAKHTFTDAEEFIERWYSKHHGESDEFIEYAVNGSYTGLAEGDKIFIYNFRSDRMRQLSKMLKEKAKVYTMTQYFDDDFEDALFPKTNIKNTLSEVLAAKNKTQLKIAETEKYAHVTFFFNGGVEKPYRLEDRVLIQSPKVKAYDLKPEMSAYELTENLINNLQKKYDFICVNYANADMVGHTGNFEAAIKAVECLDLCMQRLVSAAEKSGYKILITSDHGNVEEMLDETTNEVVTSHTLNRVPLIYIGAERGVSLSNGGSLADIAPTVLDALQLKKPPEMTGTSLI